ncbi:hypothetical protein BCR39DRAFT_558474 [Naematelia encephala]|uniref:Uncharacterized protein n=1 Tax=Naematelia encephala TaxID=71784 RepID=A0A1Y2B7H6_9TREE|nr:hypothetical protein BCR39DRAFT_558474 [Naematelia encephala]
MSYPSSLSTGSSPAATRSSLAPADRNSRSTAPTTDHEPTSPDGSGDNNTSGELDMFATQGDEQLYTGTSVPNIIGDSSTLDSEGPMAAASSDPTDWSLDLELLRVIEEYEIPRTLDPQDSLPPHVSYQDMVSRQEAFMDSVIEGIRTLNDQIRQGEMGPGEEENMATWESNVRKMQEELDASHQIAAKLDKTPTTLSSVELPEATHETSSLLRSVVFAVSIVAGALIFAKSRTSNTSATADRSSEL